MLGDWYANVPFWRPQAALFVNQRTLLPVLVPLAPAATVVSRLRPTVELVLGRHGLAGSFIAHELDAMENAVLAKTANRSVAGMLSEFGHLAATWRPSAGNLLDLSLRWPLCPVARCTGPTSTRFTPPPPTSGSSTTADPARPSAGGLTSQASRRLSAPMVPPCPSPGSRRSVPA